MVMDTAALNHISCQAAIIDLDSTMVDTLGDFVVVLQHTLTDMGCHPIERARVAGFHDYVAKFDRQGLIAALKETSVDYAHAA